ncbi:MAG: hypothetical protein AB2693_33445 [Candidatus Thiodiazotropha sp.]
MGGYFVHESKQEVTKVVSLLTMTEKYIGVTKRLNIYQYKAHKNHFGDSCNVLSIFCSQGHKNIFAKSSGIYFNIGTHHIISVALLIWNSLDLQYGIVMGPKL